MATINSFKDIRSWQLSKDLSVACYKLTQEEQFRVEYALSNQIRKSAISVPSNISEGFERKGNKEFVNFLFIAAGSLGELQTQLIIAQEVGFLDTERLEKFESDILSIKKLIYGMVTYLKNSEQKGYKFSEPEFGYKRKKAINAASVNELSDELKAEADETWRKFTETRSDNYPLGPIDLDDQFVLRNASGSE